MNTPQENTAVLRMVGDFRNFISKNKSRKSVSQVLSFEQSRLSCDESMDFGSKKILDLVQDGQKQADRSLILSLEAKISALEMKVKQGKIEQEKEREQLKQENEWQKERLSEVQNQLQFLIDKEKLAVEEMEEFKNKAETLHTTYEQKVMNLQREKMKLEEEISETNSSNKNILNNLQNELLTFKKKYGLLENDFEETKAQLKLTNRRFHDAQCKIKELEQAESKVLQLELSIKKLEQKHSSSEEDLVVARTMKTELAKIPDYKMEIKMLKEKNNHLRITNENCLLLKEEIEDLKSKLKRAETHLIDLNNLKVENENLKSMLSKWEITDTSGVKKYQSAEEFKQCIAELQQKEALLTNDKKTLESKLRCCELALKLSEENIESVTKDLKQENISNNQNIDLVRRLRRRLLLVSKERDSYRKILDSYENQITMDFSNSMRLRITELETTLENYRTQLEELEADIKLTKDENSKIKIQSSQNPIRGKTSSIPSESDAIKIEELSERIKELESKYAIVLEEKFILESRIEQRALQGDYDPSKLKVIHMKINPESCALKKRAEELEKLREENQILWQRVKLLEESGGKNIEDLTDKVHLQMQEPFVCKEVETVKTQLSSAEQRNQRLLETFKKFTREYKDIVYLLLGYKIDLISSGQYKLLSSYAESDEDYVRFQKSPNGEMQLLATKFSSSLEKLIETYLHKQDSIPAFLSSLTLELCNRHTR